MLTARLAGSVHGVVVQIGTATELTEDGGKTGKGRARKPQPEGERRETKGPGEYPATRTPCSKERSDTVGVLGGEIRAMAACAVEMADVELHIGVAHSGWVI